MSSEIPAADHSTPEALPPAPPLPPYTPPPPGAKKPWVALLLSFLLTGLGQMYNGQSAKGLALFAVWLTCLYVTIEVQPMPFALMIAFVYLFNVVDAYTSGVRIAAGGRAAESGPVEESAGWGLGLIGLGALLLLNNLNLLRLADFVRFWPLALILAGIYFIYGSSRWRPRANSEADSGETDFRS